MLLKTDADGRAYDKLINQLKRYQGLSILVNVLVAIDCDGLCACHIFSSLLRQLSVRHMIHPVSNGVSISDFVKNKIHLKDEHCRPKCVVTLNCGGQSHFQSFIETMKLPSDLLFIVIDSHRPVRLENIKSSFKQVWILDDDMKSHANILNLREDWEEIMFPGEEAESFSYHSDSLDTTLDGSASSSSSSSLKRSWQKNVEIQGEMRDGGGGEGEGEYLQDSQDSSIERRRRRKTFSTQERKLEQKKIRDIYYSYSYVARSAGVAVYRILEANKGENIKMFWLACVSAAYQFIMGYVSQEEFDDVNHNELKPSLDLMYRRNYEKHVDVNSEEAFKKRRETITLSTNGVGEEDMVGNAESKPSQGGNNVNGGSPTFVSSPIGSQNGSPIGSSSSEGEEGSRRQDPPFSSSPTDIFESMQSSQDSSGKISDRGGSSMMDKFKGYSTDLKFEIDLRCFMYRQWTIFDSFTHTSYVNGRLGLHSQHGVGKLEEFFAEAHVQPKDQHQVHSCINKFIKQILRDKLEEHGAKFQLDELTSFQFIRTSHLDVRNVHGLASGLEVMTASDEVHIILGLLEDEALHGDLSAFTPDQVHKESCMILITDEDGTTERRRYWEIEEEYDCIAFWSAYDAIAKRDPEMYRRGSIVAKKIRRQIAETANNLRRKGTANTRCGDLFRFVQLENSTSYFRRPLIARQLALWMLETRYKFSPDDDQNDHKVGFNRRSTLGVRDTEILPQIMVIPDAFHHTNLIIVVCPSMGEMEVNYFGAMFRRAAVCAKTRMKFDFFTHGLIFECFSDDFRNFWDMVLVQQASQRQASQRQV